MKRRRASLFVLALGGTVLIAPSHWGIAQEAAVPAKPVAQEASPANASSAEDLQLRMQKSMERMEALRAKLREGKLKEVYDEIEAFTADPAFHKGFIPAIKLQLLTSLQRRALEGGEELEGLETVATTKRYLEDAIEDTLQPSNSQNANEGSLDAPSMVLPFAQYAAMILSAEDSPEGALDFFVGLKEKVLADGSGASDESKQAIASTLTFATLIPNAKLVGVDEVAKTADEEIAKLQAILQEKPDSDSIRQVLFVFISTRMASANEEVKQGLIKQLEELADSAIATSPKAQDVLFFGRVYSSVVNAKSSDGPAEAKELLDKAIAKLKPLTETGELKAAAYSASSQLSQMLRRIETVLKQQELIGKPAPEFDAEHWVNGDAISLDELQGKVVLIDFWAVWCGPCIATFPELKKWNEKYSDKGLVIIGVTGPYGYVWDEEAQEPTRPDNDAEVPLEMEVSMLEKFIAAHELPHRTMVRPKSSTMGQDYGVTGIPHVALLDKDGNIALIQVGSGTASAKRIEAKIKELLEAE